VELTIQFLVLVLLLVVVFKLIQLEKFIDKLKEWQVLNIEELHDGEDDPGEMWPLAMMPKVTRQNKGWWYAVSFIVIVLGTILHWGLGLAVGVACAVAIFHKSKQG